MGTTITLQPEFGLYADYSWRTTDLGIYNVGHLINVFCYGGFVFNVPDLRYQKITNAVLNIRTESQPQLIGSGKLWIGAFEYTGLSSIVGGSEQKIIPGLDRMPRVTEVEITGETAAALNYPSKLGFTMSFYADEGLNTGTQYIRANYAQCSLKITYEPYILPPPTDLKPGYGICNPGEAIPVSWTYRPSDYPADIQTGSILEYSVNNGTWVVLTLNNKNNSYSIPAGTLPQSASVRLRVKTKSLVGGSEYSSVSTITTYSTKPPDTLSPDGASRNPNSTITCRWQYVKSDMDSDRQIRSVLRYRIGAGSWVTVTKNDALNTHSFPPGTFADTQSITWQVQTVSNVGTSDWSALASFVLGITPPLSPIPVYPVNISVSAAGGVLLEWIYNSEYDKTPSRFDAEYRIDKGVWKHLSNSGQLNVLIPGSEFDDEQHTADWRVMAYGEFGDPGAWSDTVTFWTFGLPPKPKIVDVSNSSLPVIVFSAVNLLSWELEIVHNGKAVYSTGYRPFTNELHHKVTEFIPNGNYIARIRIANEHGLASGWGELAFTISAAAPEPLRLSLHRNTFYCIKLSYNNNGQTVYIYRSLFEKDEYKRIAKTTAGEYADYTVSPGRQYKYFVRTVSTGGGYSDSNTVAGSVYFRETTLAECETPRDMLSFLYMIDAKPQKNISVVYEKTLTMLAGRHLPLLQVGEHKTMSISFAFFCSAEDLVRLEELAGSRKVILLRDRRYGAVYGTISGDITAGIETGDGFVISFTFSQTDYRAEADL